jgi:acyl-CoA thioesterase
MTMSYFEQIKECGREANPFFCLMGIDVMEITDGKAALRMEIRPDMLNGEGWLQGGMFTALADEAMVLAIYSLLAEGETMATISETTSFMRGARDGFIVARGNVVKKGRRVAFAEAEVRDPQVGGQVMSRTTAAFALTKA